MMGGQWDFDEKIFHRQNLGIMRIFSALCSGTKKMWQMRRNSFLFCY